MFEYNIEKIEKIVAEQNEWRSNTINLIASENVLSNRARTIMGSDFAHRYAEGHPGERYYQGTEKIDEIEAMLKKHMRSLFGAKNVDVRPISGTVANEAVFSRYIKPGDVVMVNSTPGGGHISHHKAGSVGKYTNNIIDFPLANGGFHLDIDKTAFLIKETNPRALILGKSLFLFPEPMAKLAEICRKKDIILIYDAAHVLGLIAGKRFQDPLREGAHLMTGSTHKTFFGSQRGLIISNVGPAQWRMIDKGAFPASSSNHHLDTLVALAITAYEFRAFGEEYADQVIKNAKTLAHSLDEAGFNVAAKEFGFTESHQIAVNVADFGGGDEVARNLKDNNIVCNMNLLPFESLSALQNPAGIRLGAQEMTRFGMKEAEMKQIATFMKQVILDEHFVGEEVIAFRKQFQTVHYSFDQKPE